MKIAIGFKTKKGPWGEINLFVFIKLFKKDTLLHII